MATCEIAPELNLRKIIAESREFAQAVNEFADDLERIEKKYAKDTCEDFEQESEEDVVEAEEERVDWLCRLRADLNNGVIATNGDIITALFPNQTISCTIPITDRNGAKFYRTTINGVTDFSADWWNAPYKIESKE